MIIDREEVLRYLGYKNQYIEPELDVLINETIIEVSNMARNLYTYKIVDIEATEDSIYIKDFEVNLLGKDIYKHLCDSKKCAVLAVSIGIEIDNRIRSLSKFDMTKSLIFDACASEAVEKLCDEVEAEIVKIAAKEGMHINFRYSPGYGDFSLQVQKDIVALLGADKKIGLTCTPNNILLPRKSVTAIIGFVEKNEPKKSGCEYCSMSEKCTFKKSGVSCKK